MDVPTFETCNFKHLSYKDMEQNTTDGRLPLQNVPKMTLRIDNDLDLLGEQHPTNTSHWP